MPSVSGASADPPPPPRDPSGPYRVCCVCLGNICRSPMAEVVLRARLAEDGLGGSVVVDSAGTGDWHIGQRMNPPARVLLERAGYDASGHRARQFDPSWLAERDLILAMDAGNLATLNRLAAKNAGQDTAGRIRLFGEIAGLGGADVPDPYGGGPDEFSRVLAMLETGMARLAPALRAMLGAQRSGR